MATHTPQESLQRDWGLLLPSFVGTSFFVRVAQGGERRNLSADFASGIHRFSTGTITNSCLLNLNAVDASLCDAAQCTTIRPRAVRISSYAICTLDMRIGRGPANTVIAPLHGP